jgi:phosphatidylglycerol:prolipoprotein diacylglycerol transferase
MAIDFPNIDPVILNIYGPFAIRWYSLAYVIGIIIGFENVKWLNKINLIKFSDKARDNILVWVITSIIIGGRLGYILLYNPSLYLNNLSDIFKLWDGGMSFHGGIIGLVIGLYIYCKKYQISFIKLSDLFSCSAPIGIFFGRIANFINGELYGRVTDFRYGVIFPTGGDLPRHASQIYEAFTEGLLLYIILNLLAHKTKSLCSDGLLTGIFLSLYAIFRIIIENFREPDLHIGFIFQQITLGQLLSLPMLIIGIYLICRSIKAPRL